MVDCYSKLVSSVLNNKILVEAAAEITDETKPSTFNFVTNDWLSRLESDTFLQSCQLPFGKKEIVSNGYTYESVDKEKSLNITIVGYCRFLKSYDGRIINEPSIIIENSDVLAKIAKHMTSDLGDQIKISDQFKFNFHECSILSCSVCRRSRGEFISRGYSLPKLHQPCICVTKVFDGEKIYNRFYSHMEAIFPQGFIAIMNLKIYKRYNYKSEKLNQRVHRISGNVLNFIAFNEAKLDLNLDLINLGDLSGFEIPKETEEESPRKKKKTDEPILDDKSEIIKEKIDDVIEQMFPGMEKDSVGEVFSGVDLETQNMDEDVPIEDNISMVKKAKNEKFTKPRVQEELFSIDK